MLETDGYQVVRNLLTAEDVKFYRHRIQSMSGVGDDDFGSKVFECPDGVSQHCEFWPLIYHERLISVIRELLGPSARYTQHSDLHAHRTGGWHRDCACRKFGVGPDWANDGDPYQVVRVAIYLQSFEESGSSLGVVPGSHRYEARPQGRQKSYWRNRFRLERKLRRVGHAVGLCDRFAQPDARMTMWTQANYRPWTTRPSYPIWIKTEPGDAVIFDQRLYHSASPIHGPKYAVYLSYSPENQHATNHLGYYRHFRSDLGYQDLAPGLRQTLIEKNLYMETPDPANIHGFFKDGKEMVKTK